ncbi:MAG: hypothetical protein HY319_24615 [Armatimonadetes bacterium]|nr:hypothetical protein [Armatimonadota bacterium]
MAPHEDALERLLDGLGHNYGADRNDVDRLLAYRQQLARRAHHRAESFRDAIDRTRLGYEIRTEIIDPLLDRERDIRALRHRIRHNGVGREADAVSLEALLERRERSHAALKSQLHWERLPRELKFQLSDYVQARRDGALHGNIERIRQESQDDYETVRRLYQEMNHSLFDPERPQEEHRASRAS